ncbi:MAG: class I SAM-dependent methyltransferase [Chthonomonadales bacterium]
MVPARLRVRIEPFERLAQRYEAWFEAHVQEYEAELQAVRACLPRGGTGLEIGVGTGRFAAPLGVEYGVEPARAMAAEAHKRGIRTVVARGEELPFRSNVFDYSVMVTTICFLDDPIKALQEARRVLTPSGRLIIGFVDRESPLGRRYQDARDANPFYRVAQFYSPAEVEHLLGTAGFHVEAWVQALFGVEAERAVVPGTGQGSFVVCTARPA